MAAWFPHGSETTTSNLAARGRPPRSTSWDANHGEPPPLFSGVSIGLVGEIGVSDCHGQGNASIEAAPPLIEGEWPLPTSIPARKGAARRLTLAPNPIDHGRSRYRPTTERGKRREWLHIAEDIRQHLFVSEDKAAMADLDDACNCLESSIDRMLQVQWGSSIQRQEQAQPSMREEREVEDDRARTNVRFDHSWIPVTGPRLGWIWMLKGAPTLDILYPA